MDGAFLKSCAATCQELLCPAAEDGALDAYPTLMLLHRAAEPTAEAAEAEEYSIYPYINFRISTWFIKLPSHH